MEENKIWECDVCGRKFKTYKGLQKHMEKHSEKDELHKSVKLPKPLTEKEKTQKEIIEFFDKLKVKKMTGGYRIRRNLTESEIKKLYDIYNRWYNTNKKHCNVCTSITAKMYEKLKKIYDNGQK